MNAQPQNTRIAESLLEAARLLRVRGASRHRAAAYRAAAHSIARHPRDVRGIFEREGVKGLDAIPGVSLGVAASIAEMLKTRHWNELERLRRNVDPATLFESVPGVGFTLARRFRDELHVDTLEGLDTAASDGRVEHLRGIGARRAAALRGSLDHMLLRTREPGADAPVTRLELLPEAEARGRGAA